MSKRELLKRYALFIVSLFFTALGVAVTKRGELGVSPISSVANVMSCKYVSLSLGTWLIIWNCILIVGQVVILRREFEPVQLLQIPLSFLFGFFTDIGTMLAAHIPADVYAVRLVLVLCGTAILGFGIALSVAANVILNSGEAFVKAIADKSGKNFSNVKTGFDVCCVLASVALSLVFFEGKIIGTREGTILTALLTGLCVKLFSSQIGGAVEKMLAD